MLDALTVYKQAHSLGSTKTLAEVQTILDGIDRTPYESSEQARYQVEIWDKTSPINGITPDKILPDVPEGGEVYLIYIDGNLVILQPHDPDQIGHVAMTANIATQKANQAVSGFVENVVDKKVMNDALVQLL